WGTGPSDSICEARFNPDPNSFEQQMVERILKDPHHNFKEDKNFIEGLLTHLGLALQNARKETNSAQKARLMASFNKKIDFIAKHFARHGSAFEDAAELYALIQ